jgi:hypothetical protein
MEPADVTPDGIAGFEFGTVSMNINEAKDTADLHVSSEEFASAHQISRDWDAALAELFKRHPDAVLSDEPEHDDGVEIFRAKLPSSSAGLYRCTSDRFTRPDAGLRAYVYREGAPDQEGAYALDMLDETSMVNALSLAHEHMSAQDELIAIIDPYGGGISCLPDDDKDHHATDLACQHGAKVCIRIEGGAYEVALCPASGTVDPSCWPEFRNVAELGAPIPFVLGPQYGGPAERPTPDAIIWNVKLRDLPPLPNHS